MSRGIMRWGGLLGRGGLNGLHLGIELLRGNDAAVAQILEGGDLALLGCG
jgi:hypothetical protein